MQVTIINDCCDQNAKLRQVTRAGSLFNNCSVNCFGAKSELQAAGFLIDALDALDNRDGVILVNIAPRGGSANKWSNGTPFGFFRFNSALIVSSVDGYVLSLAKKLGAINDFKILDIKETLDSIPNERLNQVTKQRIINSQFRSFDFLPRAACWIFNGVNIPSKKYGNDEITDLSPSVWHVDNFGNVKTTILEDELNATKNTTVKLKIGNKTRKLSFYGRLKDVPDKKCGLVIGSSGIGNKRFVEIVAQRNSAAKILGIKEGDCVLIIK